MALGLKTKHALQLDTTQVGYQRTYVSSLRALQLLGWQVQHMSAIGIVALTNGGSAGNASKISVQISDDRLDLEARSFQGEVTDMGRNERFISQLTESIQSELNRSDLDWSSEFEACRTQFQPEDPNLFINEEAPAWRALLPSHGFAVTPILLLINLLVYIAMVTSGVDAFSPSGEDLLSWGGNFRLNTMGGEWWRLLTCCFIHIGLMHLFFNLYALFYIGIMLEPIIGSWRMIMAYLAMGITASASSLWYNDMVISAGASGAIFGLYGLFIALLLTRLIDSNERKGILVSMLVFVGYNLLYGLKGGVDNAAHIGGLVSGLLAGLILLVSLRKPESKRLRILMSSVNMAVLMLISLGLIANTSNDLATFNRLVTEFSQLESDAIDVMFGQDETLLSEVERIAIPNWQRCVAISDSIGQLDVPGEVGIDPEQLGAYSALRLRQAEVMQIGLSLGTDHFHGQLEDLQERVDSVLQLMGVGSE